MAEAWWSRTDHRFPFETWWSLYARLQSKLAELKPGETRAFSARPRGESGVAVSYTIEGRVIQVPEQGYFEDNPHCVVILGLSDTGATVETTIKTEKPYSLDV